MSEGDPDGRAIHIALVLTMVPVVIAGLLSGEPFGGGSTLALGLSALGVHGLIVQGRASAALPRARARRSSRRGKR